MEKGSVTEKVRYMIASAAKREIWKKRCATEDKLSTSTLAKGYTRQAFVRTIFWKIPEYCCTTLQVRNRCYKSNSRMYTPIAKGLEVRESMEERQISFVISFSQIILSLTYLQGLYEVIPTHFLQF